MYGGALTFAQPKFQNHKKRKENISARKKNVEDVTFVKKVLKSKVT